MSVEGVSSISGRVFSSTYESGAKNYGKTNSSAEPSSPKPAQEQEQRELSELKKRDAEVRKHESAHVGAGGQHVRGGSSYEFRSGPDGRQYAVGGEVSIDVSPVPGNPQATIAKMQIVRRAALAPAEPSGQDRSVAAAASSAEVKARQELTSEKEEQVSKLHDKNGDEHKLSGYPAGNGDASPVVSFSAHIDLYG